jgi:hypothetical protein
MNLVMMKQELVLKRKMLLNAQVLLKNQEQMKKTSLVFSLKISSTFLTNYNEVSESESDASDDDVTLSKKAVVMKMIKQGILKQN